MKKIAYIIFIFICLILLSSNIYTHKEYNVGDLITYNKMDFYVIRNSGSEEDYVTVLKKKPLTVSDINKYGGVGTDSNHINKYTKPNLD